jgi:ATP-dependent DNA helicase RecG
VAGLDLPVEQAGTGLGPAHLGRLKRMGINVVRDALQHYPSRHTDFSQTVAIAALRVDTEQTVRGRVVSSREVRMGRGGKMRSTEVVVQDEGGSRITATFFNQPFMAQRTPEGAEIARCREGPRFRNRPQYRTPEERLEQTARAAHRPPRPGLPLTEGLPSARCAPRSRKLLERYGDRIEDPLPASIRERLGLLGLMEATRQCHYPDSHEALREASTARLRRTARDPGGVQTRGASGGGDAPPSRHTVADDFSHAAVGAHEACRSASSTTCARHRAATRCRGCSKATSAWKTVVALAAMLSRWCRPGYQSVLMAPTEVLAGSTTARSAARCRGAGAALHGLVTVAGCRCRCGRPAHRLDAGGRAEGRAQRDPLRRPTRNWLSAPTR